MMSGVSQLKSKYLRWMGDLPASLTHVPLAELAIPGSHDSFSFDLDVRGGVAVDEPGSIKTLGKCCCGAGRSVIHRWAVSQRLNFREQLECGVRYFDLRVCIKAGTVDFCFLHGLYGPDVIPSMEIIKKFLDENDREVIILDFNHFYNMNDIAHGQLLNILKDVFQGRLVLPDDRFEPGVLTLESLWKTPMRIYIFYHNDVIRRHIDANFWAGYKIPSPWPNTNNVDALIRYQESGYKNGRRKPFGFFYVWHGVVTPRTGDIVRHLCGGSLEKTFSCRSTPAFVKWVEGKSPSPVGINICLGDFVEDDEFIPTVINLNYRSKGLGVP